MRRNFLLLVALAAAATSGLGQAAAPDSAKRGTAPIPDLSGMWSHPWLPGYEPLASGPTSLKNLSRSGGGSNPLQLVGDYRNPILKPETSATVKKFGEMSIAHYGFHNPRNQCWPNGLPFVLDTSGAALKAALEHGGIHLVKPSQSELESYAGHELDGAGIEATAKALLIHRTGTPKWYPIGTSAVARCSSLR